MRKLKNEELERLSPAQFKSATKLPVVIVLDNIRSMHNVGSAFRTSDAFLVEKIYLTGITARPPHREIHKTALGATDTVSWEHVEDSADCIKNLKKGGWQIICIEQVDEAVLLHDFKPVKDQKYCFVFGNEVFGVSDEVVSFADQCLEIPQFGTKHSLNVSVSIGVVIWDFWSKAQSGLSL